MSSRPTGTNENISTYGDGTRDYTALSTWEAATDNDLTASEVTEVLEGYADSASFAEQVVIAGAVTSTTYFRILRAATDNEHGGEKNTGVLFIPSSTGNIANINESNFKMSDIAFCGTWNTSTARYVTSLGGTTSGIEITNVYLYDIANDGTGTASGWTMLTNTHSIWVNCAVNNPDNDGMLSSISTAGSLVMYNCTMRHVGQRAFRNGNSTGENPILKNCLSDNAGIDDFFGTFASGTEFNASSDGTAPGTDSRTSQTFTWTSATSIFLASGDGGAKDFGKDLSADATYAFSDDIRARNRPSGAEWDIGCDEQGATAGGGVTPRSDLLLLWVGA